MNIFKKVWVWLFGDSDKVVSKAMIQVMASEAFDKHPGLAMKVLPALRNITATLDTNRISTVTGVDNYIIGQLVALQLKPAELVLMEMMVSNMKAKINAQKVPINDLADVNEYISWVEEIANYYADSQEV
jgi:hypothetical protein